MNIVKAVLRLLFRPPDLLRYSRTAAMREILQKSSQVKTGGAT